MLAAVNGAIASPRTRSPAQRVADDFLGDLRQPNSVGPHSFWTVVRAVPPSRIRTCGLSAGRSSCGLCSSRGVRDRETKRAHAEAWAPGRTAMPDAVLSTS